MNVSNFNRTLLASAILALAGVEHAAVVRASIQFDASPSETVKFSDLNLDRSESIAGLYRRLQKVADDVRARPDTRLPAHMAPAQARAHYGYPARLVANLP